MKVVKVGIDPGLSGAIAIISDTEIELFDLPIIIKPWAITSKYKKLIDVVGIADILDWNQEIKYSIKQVNIEVVGVMAQQGISSNAELVGAFYSCISAVRILGIEPNFIRPGKWKKHYGLINMPKDYSRLTALKMYPDLLPQLKRKKDVDRAEALLIGGL